MASGAYLAQQVRGPCAFRFSKDHARLITLIREYVSLVASLAPLAMGLTQSALCNNVFVRANRFLSVGGAAARPCIGTISSPDDSKGHYPGLAALPRPAGSAR